MVPFYNAEASAGHGSVVGFEEVIERLAFSRHWLRQRDLSPSELALIRVRGDSMAPTIRSGAIALVDVRSKQLSDDAVYILQRDGDLIAKRLQIDWSGGVYIRSDNQAYPPQHLNSDEASRLIVIGRVVWVGQEL
jgi:phage repressor protein C with HTH and peptisase S24 domain